MWATKIPFVIVWQKWTLSEEIGGKVVELLTAMVSVVEHPATNASKMIKENNFFIRKFLAKKPQINKAKLPTGNPKDIHKMPINCE